MTSQIKRFIDFGDITAFHFRCTADNCGTELSLPLQGSLARTTAANRCPNCNSPWLLMTDGTSGSGVTQNLDRIVQAMKAISDWGGKCEVTFEIKPDAPVPGKG